MAKVALCRLPADYELPPLFVLGQMPTEDVRGVYGWLLRDVKKRHMGLIGTSSTFAMIARWAGRHDVTPDVQAALIPGKDMIDGQSHLAAPTVLARIIVPTKNLASC